MSDPREFCRPTTFSIALFLACLLLSGIASASPSISLSKKSGPPTSQILVSGRGFKPNVGVDVYFDTKDEALVVTNGKGEFEAAKIHAPRSARPGEHWVTALERNNNRGAQKSFLVRTNWREFHRSDMTRANPFENVLNPKTVPGLGVKWSYATPDYVRSAPAVADGVVYVVSTGGMYALNAGTRAVLWSYPAGGFSSPAVANGSVYVGCGTSVCALDRGTGSLLWSYATGNWVYSSPAVANGMVYVGSDDGNVYALNASTGALLWNYATDYSVYSSPAVANGVQRPKHLPLQKIGSSCC